MYKKDGFTSNAKNSINSTSSSDSCYKNEASTAEYRWGYNKSDATPQTRPYDDLTYTILSTTEGTWKDLIKTKYRLAGHFNGSDNWDENSISFYKENKDDTLVFANITLNADKLNLIKVKDTVSGKYYSNPGVMCRSNSTSWTMESSVSQNMGFITDGYDGTYQFYLDTTTMNLTVEYPGTGGKSRVYLVTNYDGYLKYAYMWKTENGNTSNNGSYPGQKMDSLGNIGDYYIFMLKYTDGWMPKNVKFSGQGNENYTDQKWKSVDLKFDDGYQIYTNPTKE